MFEGVACSGSNGEHTHTFLPPYFGIGYSAHENITDCCGPQATNIKPEEFGIRLIPKTLVAKKALEIGKKILGEQQKGMDRFDKRDVDENIKNLREIIRSLEAPGKKIGGKERKFFQRDIQSLKNLLNKFENLEKGSEEMFFWLSFTHQTNDTPYEFEAYDPKLVQKFNKLLGARV